MNQRRIRTGHAKAARTAAARRTRQVQPATGPEKAFGAALREVRTESGMSQERLALEAGFERTYVSLIERGLKSPTIRALVKMARTLKVKPSLIVDRMERLIAGESPDEKWTVRRQPTRTPV